MLDNGSQARSALTATRKPEWASKFDLQMTRKSAFLVYVRCAAGLVSVGLSWERVLFATANIAIAAFSAARVALGG